MAIFWLTRRALLLYLIFDEAQYSWFVEHIAIQLYYLVYVYGGDEGWENREEQAIRFMKYFMIGYRMENTLDDYLVMRHSAVQITNGLRNG
ncbi:MAG: hypothetical protein K6T94_18520 [Paenibacillus sp.]|nr:hypothetical protein [Paenibacillus sp.]